MAWLAQAGVALYTANQAANAANQGNNSSGSSSTSTNPWGPTADMRAAGLTRLWELNQGGYAPDTTTAGGLTIPGPRTSQMGGYVGADGANQVTGVGRGGPRGGGTVLPGGGGGAGVAPPRGPGGYDEAAGGRRRGGSGGGQAPGGPGSGAPGGNGGFSGQSDATADLIARMSGRAGAGHALYDPANDATINMLQGGDNNPYRQQAFDAFQGMADQGADADPYLSRFINDQFNGLAGPPGGAGGAGGAGGGGGSYGGRGGFSFNMNGGGAGAQQIGVAKDIREVLDGKFMGKDNPYLQQMIDKSQRGAREQFMREKIPGINDEFQGSGMFGSSAWSNATGQAGVGLATAMADQEGALRYQDYERGMSQYDNAMGLGTQYDMNATDNDTQRMASAASAAASAYGSSSAAESARESARLNAETARRGQLLDAIGLGTGMRQGGAGGMGGLSQDYGNDWRAALGMVPELSGLDVRDLQAAGGLSLGSDNARNDFIGSQNSLRAAQMSAGSQRSALNWDKYKYNREAPMSDLAAYSDIINRLGGQYGTSDTTTVNRSS